MKKAILGGLLGGLALFVWGMVSHMALPLGEAGVRSMPASAEPAVLAAMSSAMSEHALYIIPGMDMSHSPTEEEQKAWQAKYDAGPAGIVVFNPKPKGKLRHLARHRARRQHPRRAHGRDRDAARAGLGRIRQARRPRRPLGLLETSTSTCRSGTGTPSPRPTCWPRPSTTRSDGSSRGSCSPASAGSEPGGIEAPGGRRRSSGRDDGLRPDTQPDSPRVQEQPGGHRARRPRVRAPLARRGAGRRRSRARGQAQAHPVPAEAGKANGAAVVVFPAEATAPWPATTKANRSPSGSTPWACPRSSCSTVSGPATATPLPAWTRAVPCVSFAPARPSGASIPPAWASWAFPPAGTSPRRWGRASTRQSRRRRSRRPHGVAARLHDPGLPRHPARASVRAFSLAAEPPGRNAGSGAGRGVVQRKHVPRDTPPAFLFHTADDPGVAVENSLAFARALHAAGVPVELHVFPKGPHGVGLAPQDPVLSQWPKLCAAWLKASGFLDRR